jgi:hypothetical protein
MHNLNRRDNMKIYYAHHQYIYFSRRESLEISMIQQMFPDAEIDNPAIYKFNNEPTQLTTPEIMEICYDHVRRSDAVAFGSIDGFVGKGVHDEVTLAKERGIPVYEITKDAIVPFEGKRFDLLNRGSNRVYAQVVDAAPEARP